MRTRLLLCAVTTAALLTLSGTNPAFTQPPREKIGPPRPSEKAAAKAGELKKYDDVITKEFKTQSGVFAVHRNDDRVFFEIPQEMLGRLFLWYAEVAKGPGGNSW